MKVLGTILGILLFLGLLAYTGWTIYKIVLQLKKRKQIKQDTNKVEEEKK